jgi:hypothetical protein
MPITPRRAANIEKILRAGFEKEVGHFEFVLLYLLIINGSTNFRLNKLYCINKFTRT